MTDSNEESRSGLSDTPATVGSTPSTPETSLPPTESPSLALDLSPIEQLAEGKAIRIPKNDNFSRKDVVNAFQTAFELVGGVPRLAVWANENYTTFIKLYGRLLPSQSSSSLGEANVLRLEMSVPPSPLDELPEGYTGATIEHQGDPNAQS